MSSRDWLIVSLALTENHDHDSELNFAQAILIILTSCFVIIGCMLLCVLCGPGRYIEYVRDDHSSIFDGDESPEAERRPLRMSPYRNILSGSAQLHEYDGTCTSNRFTLADVKTPPFRCGASSAVVGLADTGSRQLASEDFS